MMSTATKLSKRILSKSVCSFSSIKSLTPLEVILEGNKKWVKDTNDRYPEFFNFAGAVHKPK